MTGPRASRVCAVVLDWNQPALAIDCARALLAQAAPPAVLVVDNGSTAANRARLAAGLPAGCALVRTAHNLGFAGGMNVGIRHALARGYELVWLLNNDAFPDPGCLAELLAELDRGPRDAAVTPMLVGTDGVEQHALGVTRWAPLRNDIYPATAAPADPGPGAWLTGTAVLVRAAALRAVGGFDPRFFAYWEEVDLFHRLAAAGWGFRPVPAARCVHLGSASTGGGASPVAWHMIARNGWLFLRKHLPWWRVPRAGLEFLAGQVEQAGVFAVRGRGAVARAVLSGVGAGLTGRAGRPGPAPTRGAWVEPALRHPWRLARVIGAAARAVPTSGSPA